MLWKNYYNSFAFCEAVRATLFYDLDVKTLITDCFVLRTSTILPPHSQSMGPLPHFLLMCGRVNKVYLHLPASMTWRIPFDTVIILWNFHKNCRNRSNVIYSIRMRGIYSILKKQGEKMKRHKKLCLTVCFGALFLSFFVSFATEVKADQIKNADVFAGAQWNYVTEWTVSGEKDWVQSMCETDQYIVCYQDTKEEGQPDVITVFDRWTYDLLFEVREMDYEHGNGMTYNSLTNEIYIAPYNSVLKKNKGAIFVLDGDTLKFKRRVYISDGSWNAASIEYVESSDQYIIQSTKQNNYTFYIYDSEFNYVDTLFEGNRSLDNLFQDFCVSGDFLISVPWMKETPEDSRLHLYSISQRAYLGSYTVNLPGAGEVYELESICQSDAGEIVLCIGLTGTKRMAIYNTYVPIIYTVTTSVENGTITPTRGDVDIGSDYKVSYDCTEDYELKQLQVDGQDVDIQKHKKSYTFGNIQSDHTIWAKFTEIPKFWITTSVENGTIDENQLIRRDEDATIHFEPDIHYELDTVKVDGKRLDKMKDNDSYTFEFIQEPHSIEVSYKEIPSFTVSTEVSHGTITATNKKVYRDENYTVKYQPDKDYRLAYMKVDGKWLMNIKQDSTASSYTFTNIQKGHHVQVFYQWKYLPYAVLAGAFALCIPMVGAYLVIMKVRRKRKYIRQRDE